MAEIGSGQQSREQDILFVFGWVYN
jgi:hypothetical protein